MLFRSELCQLLDQASIKYGFSEPAPEWQQMLPLLATTLLLVGGFIFVVRRVGGAGSAMSFGRSRGRLYAQEDVQVTFNDVAGIDEAVEELKEVVEFLKTPQKYQALGGRIPRGVLLVGPPGTGKTMLAKAVAGEAGVPFFGLSGSDFVEMYVGVGAARVRDMFQQALQRSPAIIFIDELDAVRSLPFRTDEFFAAMRECHTRRLQEPDLERLTFCLLGVATPSQLIQDVNTTPFNIGQIGRAHV